VLATWSVPPQFIATEQRTSGSKHTFLIPREFLVPQKETNYTKPSSPDE